MEPEPKRKLEQLLSQVWALERDFSELSKKKPDDIINNFKLKLVNDLLKKANTYLPVDRRPFPDFTEFCEGSLPSNSDVLIILSQYRECLRKLADVS